MIDDRLGELALLANETSEAHSTYLATKDQRDMAIRDLISDGVSMYAIAKTVSLSQQAVRKIRDAHQDTRHRGC